MVDSMPRYRRSAEVRFRVVQGEGVAILQDRGEALILNGVGARIFELASDGQDVAQITDRLSGEYDAKVEQLRDDVTGFLAQMQESGLLEPVSESD